MAIGAEILTSFKPIDVPAVDALLNAMTLDQKISQMIMPALLTWDGEKVTELSGWPTLAEALRRHQYGGVILFGANIASTEQTVHLIDDLQRNNAQSAPGALPYLVAADQEGGYVARLTMGTRGTGSMAIGATGEAAEQNALATGQVFGEELAALGINVNLGPCLDIITDLADPGMSTRVFSDDPQAVSRLGLAFAEGVGRSNVITCFKHFPGAGDGSDYPTSIRMPIDQLEAIGLSWEITSGYSTDAAADTVLLQDPPVGETVLRGSVVRLCVTLPNPVKYLASFNWRVPLKMHVRMVLVAPSGAQTEVFSEDCELDRIIALELESPEEGTHALQVYYDDMLAFTNELEFF